MSFLHTHPLDTDPSECAFAQSLGNVAAYLVERYGTDLVASWPNAEVGSSDEPLVLAFEIKCPLDIHLHQKDGFIRLALYLKPKQP
jgi:hypothetical protein